MIKAVTTVYGRKIPVDAESVEHRATEVDRFIRQDGQLAMRQSFQGLTDPGIQRRAVQHVCPVIGKEHLQTGLNVGLIGFRPQRATNQRRSAVSNETGNLFLRQNRQVELMADMIYRS